MILYSPAEPASVIRKLERVAGLADIDTVSSPIPESMGVDFAWHVADRWWGIQRKELNDLISSLNDGRIQREVGQMRAHVVMPLLVVEGRVVVSDGTVMTNHPGTRPTLGVLHKRLLTLQSKGIGVLQTADVGITVTLVVDTYQWSHREGHSTAVTRPKPTGDWGKPTNRDFQVYLLASLPGVGAKRAELIIDALGRSPLTINTNIEELSKVPGIGKTTAKRIIECFEVTNDE